MTVQELFIKWLKHNNCYKQFIFNFNKQPYFHNCNSLNEFYRKYYMKYKCSYIEYAFQWTKTKEGYAYWDELYDKWYLFYKHIKEINNKYYYCKYICKLEKI